MSNFRGAVAILDYYEELYEQKYGSKPMINRIKDKWPAKDLWDHVGLKTAKQLLDFYFLTGQRGHPLNVFFNNYDTLNNAMVLRKKDRERTKRLMRETERRVNGNK